MASFKIGKIKYSFPYFTFYRGRKWQPRFVPSKALRDAGWVSHLLKDEAGQFLTPEATVFRARDILDKIEAWQNGEGGPEHVRPPIQIRSLAWLIERYYQSEEFCTDIKPRTRTNYRDGLNRISQMLSNQINMPAASFEHVVCKRLYDRLRKRHGLSSANGSMRALSVVFTFAMMDGLIERHPIKGRISLVKEKPRVRVYTLAEEAHLIATADAIGRTSMGSMIAAAAVIGQRLDDLRLLPINFSDKLTHRITQGKTDRIVNLTEDLIDILRGRLMRQQAHARSVSRGGTEPALLFIRETTGVPYKNKDDVGKDFARVRKAAAKTMPGLMGLDVSRAPLIDRYGQDMSKSQRVTFSDARDTAVTRLCRAGCTVPEACEVSGHDHATATQIWKHYLERHPELARNAGRKLKAWYQDQGVEYL